MYNGIAPINVKGTGLSGYVQRSRSAVTQLAKFTPAEYTDGMLTTAKANPLEALRSAKENKELSGQLEHHRSLRAIKLKVLLYREEREAAGVPPDVISRECATLHGSLLRNYMEEAQEARRLGAAELAQKTAERFASAFQVRPGSLGDAFDRRHREVERQAAEGARKEAIERRIVERVKRIKGE
ncbi:hypothetical protein, conserved [Trypanosoma brucei gambiense DAL972]|nr:hypothetical protein, conserved [Trypanosoma brucei gambiense DAL972]CBH14102.1 hypothetical protein, conserved [Trypanosoma brucei gambiense DAL972]|eukprot:XP_011776373.1 hypothetical protein, conserved [Trypanosoma brucei gambiense DAL972]